MTAGMAEPLWEKLMEGEPEPDHEITASDINRQTRERLADLALHVTGR